MNYRKKSLTAALRKDPSLWNGKFYGSVIYVKGFAPATIKNKRKFISRLPKVLRNLCKQQNDINKENYLLDMQFKSKVEIELSTGDKKTKH